MQILDEVDALGFNRVRYTDWGDTLSDARKQWLTPDHPSLDVIRRIAGRFRVELSADGCALMCEGSGGSGQLEEIILAIVATSGFIEPQRDPEQTTLNQFSNAGASILKMFDEATRKAYPEAAEEDTMPVRFCQKPQALCLRFSKRRRRMNKVFADSGYWIAAVAFTGDALHQKAQYLVIPSNSETSQDSHQRVRYLLST